MTLFTDLLPKHRLPSGLIYLTILLSLLAFDSTVTDQKSDGRVIRTELRLSDRPVARFRTICFNSIFLRDGESSVPSADFSCQLLIQNASVQVTFTSSYDISNQLKSFGRRSIDIYPPRSGIILSA